MFHCNAQSKTLRTTRKEAPVMARSGSEPRADPGADSVKSRIERLVAETEEMFKRV
jgi:hypothetical protein